MPNKKISPGKMKAMTGKATRKRQGVMPLVGAAKPRKDISPSVTYDKDGNITIRLFNRSIKNIDKVIKAKKKD
tara:strand:- start:370 stop:588 length:219 start_codon:yes stop_codon:yes gene_type:complete